MMKTSTHEKMHQCFVPVIERKTEKRSPKNCSSLWHKKPETEKNLHSLSPFIPLHQTATMNVVSKKTCDSRGMRVAPSKDIENTIKQTLCTKEVVLQPPFRES